MPRVRARQNGEHLEIDVLAYANGDINTAFLVRMIQMESWLLHVEQLLRSAYSNFLTTEVHLIVDNKGLKPLACTSPEAETLY